jgi:hypothetical protein
MADDTQTYCDRYYCKLAKYVAAKYIDLDRNLKILILSV